MDNEEKEDIKIKISGDMINVDIELNPSSFFDMKYAKKKFIKTFIICAKKSKKFSKEQIEFIVDIFDDAFADHCRQES